jgi:hypothetical protein
VTLVGLFVFLGVVSWLDGGPFLMFLLFPLSNGFLFFN